MSSGQAGRQRPAMTAVDCVQSFVDLWDRIGEHPAAEIGAAWTSEYVERLPGPVLASLQRHRFAGDIERAVLRMPSTVGDLLDRRDAVQAAVRASLRQYAITLGITPGPFGLTTMVGAFGADGWVDMPDGVVSLVIAVEALESSGQAALLVRHEIAHVVHLQVMADDDRWDIGDAVFEEGLATALSGIGSDASDGMLCSAGRTTTWQGEPVDAWAVRCAAVWPAIRARIMATFSSEDHDDYDALFLGGNGASDLPSRAGYYAGLRLVRTLAESTPWPEIVRWDRETARSAIQRALLADAYSTAHAKSG